MKKRETQPEKQRGGVLVLLALTLPVILMIAAGAFMIFGQVVANEEVQSSAKLVLLAAAEAYFDATCDGLEGRPANTEDARDNCHQFKMTEAVARANEVRALHASSIGALSIGFSGDGSGAGSDASIEPFRYIVQEPPESSPGYDEIMSECGAASGGDDLFPCLLARDDDENDELANAFTFTGTVKNNRILNAFGSLFGSSFADKKRTFFVKARAVPMRMCAAIDISRSSSYMTHPKTDEIDPLPSYPLDEDGDILRLFRGNPYNGFYNSWLSLEDEREMNVPMEPRIEFYKDDYAYIKPFPDTEAGYNEYETTYAEFSINHPNPANANYVDTDGGIEEGSRSGSWNGDPSLTGSYSGTSDRPAYLVDLFRHESSGATDELSYKGPEPWLSIMKGVHASMQVFRDRAVAGDKACLVFYNDRLTWKGIVNLTDNFEYVQDVLDPGQIVNENNLLDHYYEATRWDGSIPNNSVKWDRIERCGESPDYGLNDEDCMPLWARLGLFPIAGTFTNSVVAIAETMRQFEEDPMHTPSTDLVVHFGDGLTSCFHNEEGAVCDSSRHKHYLKSMKEIEQIINKGMRGNNISFHNFLVGDHVQPHTLNIKDENDVCLTDAEARKVEPDHDPVSFVNGQGFNFWEMEHETIASNNAYNMYRQPPDDWTEAEKDAWVPVPFRQVNSDWYNLVRMTGGVWAPLRPKVDGCDPASPTPIECTIEKDEAFEMQQNGEYDELKAHMQTTDPFCREINQQVEDYLTEALKSASSFTIIE